MFREGCVTLELCIDSIGDENQTCDPVRIGVMHPDPKDGHIIHSFWGSNDLEHNKKKFLGQPWYREDVICLTIDNNTKSVTAHHKPSGRKRTLKNVQPGTRLYVSLASRNAAVTLVSTCWQDRKGTSH